MPKAQDLFKTFSVTGVKDSDIPKICKLWNYTFSLNEYKEEWSLSKRIGKGGAYLRARLTKEQAEYIIKILGLLKVQDSIFRLSFHFKRRQDLEKDLEKVRKEVLERKGAYEVALNIETVIENALYWK